jgi:hypothetical protein
MIALTEPSEQIRWALDYIASTYDKDQADSHVADLKSRIKPYIMENGEPDENGNFIWEFEKPMFPGGDTGYSGLMAQRRVSEYINEDTVYALIDKYQAHDRCIKTVVVQELDVDELYAMNQEGIIPDEEIDSILEITETYALVKMKL